MSFAAVQNRGVRSLTALVLLGWSVAATAQPAAPAPTAVPNKPGDKAPSATPTAQDKTPTKAAQAQPAGAVKAPAAPAAASQTASQPASTKPAEPAAAAPGTGESWVRPATGQGPSSPWPEGAAPADANAPPPVYYVEQAPTGHSTAERPPEAPLQANNDYEPMRLNVEEPPPPPVPRHVAPRTALWLGARVGYFVPFGDLWGRCSSAGYSACDQIQGAKFSEVAASGPMFELDIGARLARNYVVYFGWERTQLGGASGPSPDTAAGTQLRSESDYFAVGVRLSADPDDIGLLLDLSIGARRFRGYYPNDVQLQLTDAPMESRLGIGLDIRTHRRFTLSPMLTVGLGSFSKAEWITPTTAQTAVPGDADRMTHGWVTLQLGGHFDIGGS